MDSPEQTIARPEGYPLPWCYLLHIPYWKLNAALCMCRAGWLKWQSDKQMAAIIPEIDKLLEKPT